MGYGLLVIEASAGGAPAYQECRRHAIFLNFTQYRPPSRGVAEGRRVFGAETGLVFSVDC